MSNTLPPRLGTNCLTLTENSTADLRKWIQKWQFTSAVNISEETLSLITWTSTEVTSRESDNLVSDLMKWGLNREEARLLVGDLLAAMGRGKDLWNFWYFEKTRCVTTFGIAAINLTAAAAIAYFGTQHLRQ
jgi:hypothetical protein